MSDSSQSGELVEVIITPETGDNDSGALKPSSSSTSSTASITPLTPSSGTTTMTAPTVGATGLSGLVLSGLAAALTADSEGSTVSGAAPAAVAGSLAQLVQTVRQQWAVHPWSSFFDKERFALKPSGAQAEADGGLGVVYVVRKRLPANLKKFQTNYIIVSLLLLLYGVLTTPGLLLVLLALAVLGYYLLFWRNQPLVVFNREVSQRQKLLGLAVLAVFLVVFTTPATSAFTWIASMGVSFILLHAALFQSDDERPDDLFLTV